MRIVMPGGTGQIGRVLERGLTARGHEVVILSRHQHASRGIVGWDGRTLGDWARVVDGASAVINLAGRSVNCRYTEANLIEMMQSRVDSARVIGEAIARSTRPPAVWLQASTATIYEHNLGAPFGEDGPLGGHEPGVPRYWARSTDIAKAWEATCLAADTPHTRRVLLRTSYAMSPDPGGIFDVLCWLVRHGLGGPLRSGRQRVSWIHEHDLVAAVQWLLDHEVSGPVNLAAPNPLPYGELMARLRQALGVRLGLPINRWMARLGAIWLQTDVELVEKSRCVVSHRLAEAGFTFEHPHWAGAVRELAPRWPTAPP